ncbi:alpha/beta hydrolase [Altererythrobacter sp. CC-YST694]|uniref:alpha/beta hydrolase n=1 Tax=Altererythrobacter sp. CC-YST694 TaxID=2755038 RepID=UPI001D019DDB|nr:alpha/beta hydrolase [Altererythrobacter sp. CC-YST694]MCB5425985.1 alpha/beta hydrolase [Altererythrobacter sp. CC-YST694]
MAGFAALERRTLLLASAGLLALAGAKPAFAQRASAETMSRWATAPSIPLWPGQPPAGGFVPNPPPADAIANFITNVAMPELRVFRPDRPNGRAVLSIPGGAYTFVSIANEGVDLAQVLTARGYTVFVLVYRLPGEGWHHREDVPLQDAQRAVRLIRSRAAQFGIGPDSLHIIGFSAGGHLAASLATGFAERVYDPVDGADALSAQPSTVGLIYPVIGHEPGVGHAESSLRLLGENPSPALVAKRSPDLHVGPDTPPTFLMHALDDPAVPVENSLRMLKALRGAGRPVEAHLFEEGGHGFGLGRPDLPVSQWSELYTRWLERHEAKKLIAPRGEGHDGH